MTEVFGIAATVLAVAGVLTNNRRLIVCFYLWMVSNAVSLGLHATTGLWSLAVRDGIFFVLCVEGIVRWRKIEDGKWKIVNCRTATKDKKGKEKKEIETAG